MQKQLRKWEQANNKKHKIIVFKGIADECTEVNEKPYIKWESWNLHYKAAKYESISCEFIIRHKPLKVFVYAEHIRRDEDITYPVKLRSCLTFSIWALNVLLNLYKHQDEHQNRYKSLYSDTILYRETKTAGRITSKF